MHSPRALAPRGGAPITGLATPPPKGGLCSFCLLITREGACPLSGWLGGGQGGVQVPCRSAICLDKEQHEIAFNFGTA